MIQQVITRILADKEKIYQLPFSALEEIQKETSLKREGIETGGGFDFTFYTNVEDNVCIAFEHDQVHDELYAYAYDFTERNLDLIKKEVEDYGMTTNLHDIPWSSFSAFQAFHKKGIDISFIPEQLV